MKIHKNIKIELACSKDATRRAISEPYLSIAGSEANLVATDGKIMAMIPVELSERDAEGFVSGACLAVARKALPRGGEVAEITVNGQAVTSTGISMPRAGNAGDSQFPNWRQVVPSDDATPLVTIGVDAKLLWQLAQAMGCQSVAIAIKDPCSPFVVTPTPVGRHSDAAQPVCMGARGLIMPVALPEKETQQAKA